MAKGGRQPGAGRPKGSTNVPRFADYVTDDEREEFVRFQMSKYKESDTTAKWVGDHLFRKPPQDIGDGDGGALKVEGVTISVRK